MISTMIADHAERREVLRTLREPEVVLGGADQTRGQAAEGMRQGGPLRNRGERHPRERNAHHEAGDDRQDDPAVVHDLGLDPGRHDGDDHGGHAGIHALPGGRRGVHPVQREDEQDGRDQVGELDDPCVHEWPSRFGLPVGLNIFSMRSVIRKPLTMFVIEANSAIAPMMRIPVG